MPVDAAAPARLVAEKPLVALPRDSYTYRPGTQSIPFFAAPRVLNRPHSITADVEIPAEGAEGVLLSQGTAAGGYALFVRDGKLRYVHNYVGRAVYGVESDTVLAPGKHTLRFEFEPTGQPDMAHGKARPASSSSTSTAPSPGTRRRPSPTCSSSIPAPHLRRQPRIQSPMTTPARSSPAPSTV
jgi:arylsulfatase